MEGQKHPAEPADIQDLESMYYDSRRKTDRIRYEGYMESTIFSPAREEEVINIFSKLGKCHKIPTESKKRKKTFDFVIDAAQLLIEVTAIDLPHGENQIRSDEYYIENKIKTAIKHAEKDPSSYSGYYTGVVVFFSVTIIDFLHVWERLSKLEFQKKVISCEIDYVIFLPERASIAGIDSREVYRPYVLVKNDSLHKLFRSFLPSYYNLIEIT